MKHSQRRNYHLLYESTQPRCIQFTAQIKELHQKAEGRHWPKEQDKYLYF